MWTQILGANVKFLPPLRVDANFMRANAKSLPPLRVDANFMRANAKSLPPLRSHALSHSYVITNINIIIL